MATTETVTAPVMSPEAMKAAAMVQLEEARATLHRWELSRRPVFAAEPQPVEITVLPGMASHASYLACRFCPLQVIVYSAPLFVLGRIARSRGWTNRKDGLGWMCPACEATER